MPETVVPTHHNVTVHPNDVQTQSKHRCSCTPPQPVPTLLHPMPILLSLTAHRCPSAARADAA
ncbi:hypothetical protein HN51_063337, partial [Arachis hypogaea]